MCGLLYLYYGGFYPRGFLGVTLVDEVFTDLEFEDDVSLIAEMLEILILSLDVMRQEVCPFGLEISWTKTKIQTTVNNPSVQSEVMVAGNVVEIVEKFTYLGSHLDHTGGSDAEVIWPLHEIA